MSFSPLGLAVMTKYAEDENLSPSNQTFYALMGGLLGTNPVGLGIALALVNQQQGGPVPASPPSTNALTITSPPVLTGAIDGQAYSYTLHATGGTGPYNWNLIGGAPASGNFSLSANGILSGKADVKGGDDGGYALQIQVTDSATTPTTVTQYFLFKVAAAPVNPVAAAPKMKMRRRRP
jgi:hypothetical protein